MNKKSRLFLGVALTIGGLSTPFAFAQQQATPAQGTPSAAQQGLNVSQYQQPSQPQPVGVQQPQAQPQAQQPAPGYYGGQQPPVAAQPQQAAPVNAPPSVPPTALPPLPAGSNAAEVDAIYDMHLGLTPEQIRTFKKQFDERYSASNLPVKVPKPVTGSISVSLSPGATPPVIRTFAGNVTSLVVLDSTGAPWPIENFRVGDAANFPVDRLDGPGGSSLTIDSKLSYRQSNLVLKLAGVASPVVLNIIDGQDEHDARVELRVQGRGPNAVVTSGTLIRGTNSDLMPVLDGIAPPGGRPVKVSGLEDIRAWLLPDGKLMVKSPYRIIAPATPTFVSSADGTTVYVFAPTTKLMSLVDGNYVDLTVTGW